MSSDTLHLIAKFKEGDKAAYERLVRLYQDRVYSLCRHLLSNAHEAEDAAQDSFIKAYRNLSHFTPDASFYTWLYRITVNTCLDYKKRPFFSSLFMRSSDDEEFQAWELPDELSPERLYESKQMGQALQRALQKISPKFKVVIVLKEMEGLTYEEIAEVLDVSMGTVKSRISRAREELVVAMKKITEQK
ncbi:MAG: sigma-70 family RNA polymerase sigma factor [Desulfobulbaceae bacterium]|nr:sigma-70 family RNA polymerase sigma factor [Desulfobulbaceae bacterium]